MGNPFVTKNDDDDGLVNIDPKNLWCIHGKRYDLRMHNFLDRHPGVRPCCRSLPSVCEAAAPPVLTTRWFVLRRADALGALTGPGCDGAV